MIEQRWEMLRHYFKNHCNVAECVRKMRTDFRERGEPSAPYVRYLMEKVKETDILIMHTDIKGRGEPSAPYIRYLVEKMKETDILIDKPKRENPKTVRIPKNINAAAESVREAPSASIHVVFSN